MTNDVRASDQGGTSSAAHRTPPGANATLALLLIINLFNYIDRQVLAAVEPAIRDEFFKPDDPTAKTKMGLLATSFMVSYMVTAPLFGWLADRMSRWLLMGIGVALWSVASGASGWAPTFLFLLITRCFMGLGEAAYGPAAPTVLADLYPRNVRGRIMALFYMAIPVGSALGYALGGLMLWLVSWRWAFYFDMPVGLLLALCCFFMPEPRRGQSDANASGPEPARRIRFREYAQFLRNPSYVLNTLGMTAMTFAIGGIAYWMPAYIYEDCYERRMELATVTAIFGVITVVAGLTATLLGGVAGDRLQPRFPGSYFLVSGVSMAIGFVGFLLFLVTPFPWAWGLVFVGVFCLFFNTGPTNTILANVIPPSLRATAFALNIFIIHALGDAISPLIIGAIADRSSLRVGFVVVAGMILVGALLWLRGARYLERDTARALTGSDRESSG
ncbi:MAG: spinster family MFS transporter [Gemmataceae bacterium]